MVKNVHLLYALMHSYHTVEAHFTHPAVSAILASSGLPGDLGGVILSTTKKHLAAVEALGGENHENNFSAAQVPFLRTFIVFVVAAFRNINFILRCSDGGLPGGRNK